MEIQTSRAHISREIRELKKMKTELLIKRETEKLIADNFKQEKKEEGKSGKVH